MTWKKQFLESNGVDGLNRVCSRETRRRKIKNCVHEFYFSCFWGVKDIKAIQMQMKGKVELEVLRFSM